MLSEAEGKQARIAVFVSGGGTNLQALLDAETEGVLHSGKVSLVLSSKPGVYALERAAKHGVPSVVVDRRACGSLDVFEEQVSAALREHQIDLIVLAGFLTILSADFVSRWPERIINIHPSLIPSFCGKGFYGLRVHEAALEYGVKVTGATAHFVNEVCDGGRIILQRAVEIAEGDTPEILQRRVMEQAEWYLLPRAAELVSADIVRQR